VKPGRLNIGFKMWHRTASGIKKGRKKMNGKLYPLGLALILSALILSSCSSGEEAGRPSASANLIGTEWVLTSLNGNSLIEGTSITLKFDQAFLSGSAGCNGYGGGRDSGRYVATDDGTLTIPQIAVTVQLCLGPEGIMEQEAAYIEALRSAAAYRVIDDRLEVDDATGETVLVFAMKE
jgi:heat shock protein HslJ